MSTSYLPCEPQQQRLLPDALQDWLPEGHLAYFISDSVDSLDLSAFHARYAKGGPRNQPFHPAMMVKVLIFGYATGTFSSRKLAARLHEDIALRVPGADNYPAHRTLSDFRALHLEELATLFFQVVRLARECGLVKLGTVAVDDTKLKANASRHKAMSYDRMVKAEVELKAQIDGLLNLAKAADSLERNEPELDIPAEIRRREDRLVAITAAKLRLEQRQRESDIERGRSEDNKDANPAARGRPFKRDFGIPKDSAQESFTDPDSRIMKRAGGGHDYSFNAHTAVDETAQIVIAAELTNDASDSDRLPVLLAAIKANLGQDPRQVLADAGFRSEAVFTQLRDSSSELIVALGREGKQAVAIDVVRYPHTAAMASRLPKAKRPIANASGSWKHLMDGSRVCWDSGSSAFAD